MQKTLFRRVRNVVAKVDLRANLRADFTASLVVFLIAVPLSVGIAVASGVPVELGLVTGIVGGLLTGLLPGSSMQVSGPAAGLTVLVYEAVREYGLRALGVLVLTAGLLQLAMGLLKLGRWFRAISVAVVQGMLAGIGVVLIAGQLYALADADAPAGGLEKLGGLVTLLTDTLASGDAMAAVAVGGGTAAVLVLWPHWQRGARVVPGPLAAVALATAVVGLLQLPVDRVQVRGILDAIQPPGGGDFARLTEFGVLGTVLAFALIASAESLFSAAAVDRLHDGTHTDYDKELIAQGAGNTVCGVLGALPMTAVIVRSSANVRAGARTKVSRVLHGVWLLVFATLLPWALELIPVAALAGVLVHAGWKLIPGKELGPLWKDHRGEVAVLVTTTVAIVVTNLFEGVIVGLLMAVAKSAWETSHVHIETAKTPAGVLRVRILGNATFLRLPKLLDELEELRRGGHRLELDLRGLRHMDRAVHTALRGWAERHAESLKEGGGGDGPDRDENGNGEATGRVVAV
ncbi:SulP family inorganic anion transporter [Streptomyces cinnamoneus]|uniref:SulP family inorganic anion transporter n=1 Tax=Streptomyces cinnamoneus TaxID=53446 RepID=UPI0033CC2D12